MPIGFRLRFERQLRGVTVGGCQMTLVLAAEHRRFKTEKTRIQRAKNAQARIKNSEGLSGIFEVLLKTQRF